MDLRSRFVRFSKKVLRVGKANDQFFGGPKRAPSASAAAAENETHSRTVQGL